MILAAGLAALAGCAQQPGNEAAVAVDVDGNVAVSRSEAGAVPEPMVAPSGGEARAVETAGLLPPRAEMVPATPIDGAVAFAYRTPDAPATVARWYRASRAFNLQSELNEGGEHVLSGTVARPAGDFSVRLAAHSGGGTTAMVLVTPRR